MRGGEKALESICRLLPDADIFTLFYQPEEVSPLIRAHKITTSFLNPLRRFHRSLLPLMPMALECFDLREFDLVISSESGPAKGVLTRAGTTHLCYCHTPMRYLWDLYPAYLNEWTAHSMKRMLMAPLTSYLRLWDYASATRVDEFIASSHNAKQRIWKTYRRESEVVPPGVPVETFYYRPPEDYYLTVSELVPYKRINIAIQACSKMGRHLRVVGKGPEYRRLKSLAGPSIEFCGHVSDQDLRDLYAGCRALLMPGEEDFGLIAVEALASGKPVIALARGGALEVVPRVNPLAGVFFEHPDTDQLTDALLRFEALEQAFQPKALQAWAARYSEQEFQKNFGAILARCGVPVAQPDITLAAGTKV
jgi:glycosyltransferase involved in cell wall biosynthesis